MSSEDSESSAKEINSKSGEEMEPHSSKSVALKDDVEGHSPVETMTSEEPPTEEIKSESKEMNQDSSHFEIKDYFLTLTADIDTLKRTTQTLGEKLKELQQQQEVAQMIGGANEEHVKNVTLLQDRRMEVIESSIEDKLDRLNELEKVTGVLQQCQNNLEKQVSRRLTTMGAAGGAPRSANMAGVHDHVLFTSTDEPELEFDVKVGEKISAKKAELGEKLDAELAKEGKGGPFRGGAITPEGLIDEDFEAELGMPLDGNEEAQSKFTDLESSGIVKVAGDDRYGRKVIVISACKLPADKNLDHQKFLQYIKHKLNKYVVQDYVLVYFHYGLNSRNKPKLSWLLQAYRELNRQYKKNLKTLYLVHPTNFIKVLWNIFRPFISVKFGKKLMYVNYLVELRNHLHFDQLGVCFSVKFSKKLMYVNYLVELKNHLHFDQLPVPEEVLKYDSKKTLANRPQYPYNATSNDGPSKTQQFGVSLQFLEESGRDKPIVVEQTIAYMRSQGGVEVEGIFCRCANLGTLKEVQEKYNTGVPVDFADYPDIHVPATILKKFLRELREPLMTFDLFEPITRVHCKLRSDETYEVPRQLSEVQRMLLHELPKYNYNILKFILEFLVDVAKNAERNKMTAANIATVFGPNLAWSKGQDNLSTVEPVIKFTRLLIEHFDDVFLT